MGRELTVTELLAALVATHNLTLADVVLISDYAAAQEHDSAESLESALDRALDHFNDSPDIEAAKTAAATAAAHDAGVCPDCGGETMDQVDIEQAIDLWQAVRMVVDKYAFDQSYDGPEIEEC